MRDVLQRLAAFTPEELRAIESLATRRTAHEKQQVMIAGPPFTRLWFVAAGLLRAYRIIDGEDFTYFFFTAQDFAVDYQSFLTEQASSLYFEALVETEYYEWSKADILRLYDQHPRFERLGRLMAERAYLSAAERLMQHQTDDLEMRYRKLLAKNPQLFLSIPQYHIASYLGVKPQSLSRIRARVAHYPGRADIK
ncbi:Crp/Fnr family transcriptional regulator [Hymenobacter sp. BT664]|uniref:Crp/Fnr family transcriptional regulator n=1 Tax=Hymenobacter montanus TaxID=2771359 RepID=A0A927BC91_9BACT|nr:Crp/Fnr family transcriptional regulator [Hymenobacter montanus]MBD2768140.1 Crp/Fnr family transcriptional regulator [Hymenobacter montanus]